MTYKIHKILCFALAAVLLLALPAGCAPGTAAPQGQDDAKLDIVTTIFPPYDFVRAIAGENVRLTMLLPPGAESHSFEPTPQDIITIQNCDVFIYVGGDSDAWIEEILASMDTSHMRILSLMDMVDVKEEAIVEGMEHSHEGHAHDAVDPAHVKDRPLANWEGGWATIETALANGALDTYVRAQAEEHGASFETQYATFENAWKTAYPAVEITGDRVTFTTAAQGTTSASYTYTGYEIVQGEHGPAVWYGYEKQAGDAAAPRTLVLNDHSTGNAGRDGHGHEHEDEHAAPHTHLRYGDGEMAQLAAETSWAPFYFAAGTSDAEMAQTLAGHTHGSEDAGHAGHGEAELDEHVWTSPKNAKRIVQALADNLEELDAQNAALYTQNTAAYLAQLDELDAAFEAVVQNAKRHILVFGDRFPFRYFADAYGLSYYAAFPGCSTQTEPSAATIAFLIDKIKDEGIPVVFHIEMSNEKMADTISADTGAQKRLFHSCHNVTRAEMDAGANYLDLMRQNLEPLKEALQ